MTTNEDLPHAFNEIAYRTPAERDEAARLPAHERQSRISRLLVRYPLFEQVTASVRRFHMPVKGGTHGRGTINGILGSPRAGKTWAIRNYCRSLGTVRTAEAEVPVAIHVDAKSGWSSLDLASTLYAALNLRRRAPRMSASRALDNIEDEIVASGVQLVIIDDAHCLLGSEAMKTVRDTRGFVTKLAEQNTCNVILAGPQPLRDLVDLDGHMKGRGGFDTDTVFPYDWSDASPDGGRDLFRFLLDDVDERLPFRAPSNLADERIAAHLYRLSDGLIGRVMNYVRDAAFRAMNDEADAIGIEHLREAAQGRRLPGDPYEPFVSGIDLDDPTGARARRDAEETGELTFQKRGKRGRKPVGRSA